MLFPAFISSLLLWIASTRLFRVKWTEQIHAEWIERRLERYQDLNRAQLERRRQRMDAEFPDSLVTGYEGLIESLALPDPDDRHVLAAAITCRAHVIVTANLRDFPESSLRQYSIAAQHPDEFLLDQLDLHSDSSRLVALAVSQHKSAMTESRPTWKQYFEFMARESVLPKTHAALTTPEMRMELKDTIVRRHLRLTREL
ncbi:PIN domain-containing protein [Candidatus Obscuribacterales bacterium]|nr:PIN domain-containing protein [Candidatus Obscuribacterales bacterium]